MTNSRTMELCGYRFVEHDLTRPIDRDEIERVTAQSMNHVLLLEDRQSGLFAIVKAMGGLYGNLKSLRNGISKFPVGFKIRYPDPYERLTNTRVWIIDPDQATRSETLWDERHTVEMALAKEGRMLDLDRQERMIRVATRQAWIAANPDLQDG